MNGGPCDSSDSPSHLVLGFGDLEIGDRACQLIFLIYVCYIQVLRWQSGGREEELGYQSPLVKLFYKCMVQTGDIPFLISDGIWTHFSQDTVDHPFFWETL